MFKRWCEWGISCTCMGFRSERFDTVCFHRKAGVREYLYIINDCEFDIVCIISCQWNLTFVLFTITSKVYQ